MSVRRRGRVYLVGAGPGDPGLLTVRARELIARADVILHDRLIPPGVLDGARPAAELIFVGKEGGGESTPQAETERLLVEHAGAGRSVVRLKGGDPFVFGRGGEEAGALREAGIPFEVVPGVTAGVAAPAYAGIPVTHRGLTSAVALITGHEDPEKEDTAIDWEALAAFPGTLVFYMGVRRLARIAQELIAAGRPGSEAAAVVERGTLPGQRAVIATLETIAQEAEREGIGAPAITLVGAVARLGNELAWLRAGPLAGRTVAVTRARAQTSALAERLGELGASVVQAPAIRIRALEGPPLDPSGYDLICVTSANGVEALFERLAAGGRDARALAGARVAAIGPGTARALAAHGIVADVVPERYVAEGLVEALADVPVRHALLARARGAREVLARALRERGAQVDELELYESVPERLPGEVWRAAWGADYITFTSSSTVRNFLEAAGDGALEEGARVVSIGPVTSGTLREHGLEPHLEAARHDIDGLLETLLADATARSSGAAPRS
ncbi:MAG: uroporphyrinogen-III C-methyltransferase [Solirubrobacterales bacterium]|nr:uroporphyrinogen-III C-methyltransferase [Solirubrobacterales bacterium]